MSVDAASATQMSGSEVARLVETSEARAYAALVTGAPKELNAQHGLEVHQVGATTVFVAAGVRDSLVLNRVIGLGIGEPATQGILDELDAIYHASGIATYAAEVSPVCEPPDLPSRLRTRGFVPYKQTSMCYRAAQPIASPACDLLVRRAALAEAEAYADLSCGLFNFEEPFPSMLRATFQRPAWQQWLAFDRDRPVAAAITHVADEVAWIGWVGTLADYRGRGAQSALTAAQLQAASENGCRWVTLEAATGTKKQASQSLRNYRRLGWNVAYDRIVYVRRAQPRAQDPRES